MRKIFTGIFLAMFLLCISIPTYASNIQIKIDGVAIPSDVNPEMINNRTMVPLRVISENLGAHVEWSDSEITVTKEDITIKLKLNSNIVIKNGVQIILDVKPYSHNGRTFVPIRFLAEAFNNTIIYKDSTVTIDSEPLIIDQVTVKAVLHEYRMTMGGVIQQINGNAYHNAIYYTMLRNKGEEVEAPSHYSWRVNLDNPGSYYKVGQYDFIDLTEQSIQRYDLYSLVTSFPTETLEGYPEVLIYDAFEEKWYLFSKSALETIYELVNNAFKNGFIKIISNTVV